jgi:hypothetical protein
LILHFFNLKRRKMKNLFNSALRCNRESFAVHQSLYAVFSNPGLFFCAIILTGLLLTGCKKENVNTPVNELPGINSRTGDPEGNVINNYTSLSPQTVWELQQARAATAKYRDIRNALRDGYADIAVDVEGMGHHFMKSSIVDGTFDIREPEILVYNKNDNGVQELVAVEYAVPLTYPKPEGFTGSDDVWNGTSGFPFWLVHAWVWAYNPDGVFNWTNPLVHLH